MVNLKEPTPVLRTHLGDLIGVLIAQNRREVPKSERWNRLQHDLKKTEIHRFVLEIHARNKRDSPVPLVPSPVLPNVSLDVEEYDAEGIKQQVKWIKALKSVEKAIERHKTRAPVGGRKYIRRNHPYTLEYLETRRDLLYEAINEKTSYKPLFPNSVLN